MRLPIGLRGIDCAGLLLYLAAILAPCAQAQVQIGGRVIDENGVPLPSVRVAAVQTAASAEPGAARSQVYAATSDAAGIFKISVPAEGRYAFRAEREGFFLFSAPALRLAADSPLEIRLNHQKDVVQSLDVRYSPPVIDPQQTSDTKQITNQEILDIPYPASQDFRSALPLLQGVVQDTAGQNHFNGGASRQTNYRLNGFDVSDPATGRLETHLNVDTVQALEFQASRFSPEKGKGSAGTLDIRTEMGDDHFSFTGTNFVPGFGSRDGFHLDRWSPRVKFSGPIAKGKAWFHDAFDTFYRLDIVDGLPKGQDQTRAVSGSNLGRFQWNATERQIITGSFLLNRGNDSRHGLSFIDPVETTVNRRTALYLGSIRDQISIGGGLLEFGFASTSTRFRSSPLGNQTYLYTPFGHRGNYFVDDTRHSTRQEWLINGFLRPIEWHGSHQVQIGANVERSSLDEITLRHDYAVVRVDQSISRRVQFSGDPHQFRNNLEAYSYALDRWSPVASLLVEAGFRTQWDEYSGGAPPAPRLSAAYAPKWLHETKFAVGWGIFYDSLTLQTLALGQGETSLSSFFGSSGAQLGLPVATRFVVQPQDLRLPRYALSSLSVERRLPFNIYGRLNLISREGSRGATFQNQLDALSFPPFPALVNDYVLSNVRRDRYRAAELSVKRTFASRYEWFASYTRSQARSNSAIDYTLENPIFAAQAPGPLPWDTPNRLMTWGWAPVEPRWFPGFLRRVIGETNFSALAEYRTGFPFNVLNEQGNLVGRPQDRRYPDYCSVNIAFERKFAFRQYLWAWRVGMINVLDRANPNVVNNDIDSPLFLQYGRGQPRAVNVRLRFLGRK